MGRAFFLFSIAAGTPREETIMSEATFGVNDWVAMFRQIGLDEAAMHRWHALFEDRAPEAHQSFLEWLRLPDAEIQRIRQASATNWKA